MILSGISGTGKTKLAQHLAELLPQPTENRLNVDDVIGITIQPYMLKYNRLIVPKKAMRIVDLPKAGEAREVTLTFNGASQVCRLVHAQSGTNDYFLLLFRGVARQWLSDYFHEGDSIILEPEFDQDQVFSGFRITTNSVRVNNQSAQTTGKNWLFLPVRPDWRDSKSLLGYFNPLTASYEWTEFLRFVMKAIQSHRNQDRLAWFVILDEMNLAHVEYYFADLLSVIESGFDDKGYTHEPIRFMYPEEAEGDLPPQELYLPANLYVIGTVNVDETTHAFSPKVLDRAFSLELTDADFSDYLTQDSVDLPSVAQPTRKRVLDNFTFDGKFALSRTGKDHIIEYLANHPNIRTQLQNLNELLHQDNMHFGFRVFDEIISFLVAAEHNEMYDQLGGEQAAVDAAILMKVLSKFNGSRGKLENPLRAVLAWCINPDAPAEEVIDDALKQIEGGADVENILAQLEYAYQATAKRVRRMLQTLYTDGFATFG